jgi:hypothetical protein
MTTLRNPDSTIGPFREKDSVVLTATFLDNASPQAPIPGGSLTTATFTLYSEVDPFDIINSRDHVDIKSLISGAGVLTFALATADMAIIEDHETDGIVTEYHRALIEWTWSGGRGSWEIRIVVRDVNKVT